MKSKITKKGLFIPKDFFGSISEVEIQRKDGAIIILLPKQEDPFYQLGSDPISLDIDDASINHDLYLNHK